jgi:hypothetical protein
MLLKICKIALEKDIVMYSLKVAIVIGSVLNIINQGEVIFKMQFDKVSWYKLILTFAVPYLVLIYASVRMRLKQG